MKNNFDFEDIQVNSRETFIQFIRQFRLNLDDNFEQWTNNNLSDFLESLESYAEDVQGYYDNTQQTGENADIASWKRFADILKGARVYE